MIRAKVRRFVAVLRDRFRRRGRRAIWHAARLTAAAVASYVVAAFVFPTSTPLLAPLTALLVVQLTPVSIVRSGIQRVASVVAGVTVAVLLSSLVAITWWSLAIAVALSLLVAQALRLGDYLLEVPISAMLVLGVGSRSAETAAWKRIAETLVGAGVGVAANLLFPPKVATEDAAVIIEEFADDLARLLDEAASSLADEDLATNDLESRAWSWLGRARQITHGVPNVGSALIQAEESRRLNLRALALEDSGPGLRLGLESLEHSAVALRSMFRSIAQLAHDAAEGDGELAVEVRHGIEDLLRSLGTALAAHGGLVRAEAHPGDASTQHAALRAALDALAGARNRHSATLLVDPQSDPAFAVLGPSVLSTVDRVRQELSLDERLQRGVRRPAHWSPRRMPRPRSRRPHP